MDFKDVDNDDDLDWIIMTNNGGYKMTYIQNDGIGMNADDAVTLVNTMPEISAFHELMDLDTDGKPELFTSEAGNIKVYPNDFPIFDAPATFELNSTAKIDEVICFDIDGDPDNDLVFASNVGVLSWYEHDHITDSFTVIHEIISLPAYPISTNIKKKDYDEDGDFDLIASFTSEDGDDEITYYCLNNGSGVFTNYTLDDVAFMNVWFTDADADGDNDIIAMKYDTYNRLVLYTNTGIVASMFNYTSEITTSGTWQSFAQIDIDDDGDDDFVGTKSGYSYIYQIINANGAAGFNAPVTLFGTATNATSVFVADFDNDTDADIIYVCSNDYTYLASNNGIGFTSGYIGLFDAATLADGSHTAVFDLNSDSNYDIVYNKVIGGTGYKLSEGGGVFDEAYDFYSDDYGRFGYVDDGMVPDFIGTNNNEFYIQYNVITLAPSFTMSYPTKTWLEENGAGDAITFTFDVIPQSELIINIFPSGSIDAGEGEGEMVVVHILPDSSALIPKTVSWNVPDDAIVEDVIGSTVEIIADPATWSMYSGLINLNYPYTVTDNELGVFMSATEFNLIEGIISDTLYAHINMVPDYDVEITLSPDALYTCGFGLLVTPTHTLTAGLTGLEHFKLTASVDNDLYFDATVFTEINFDFTSADVLINNFIVDSIPVIITDDDVASVLETFPTVSISEGIETFEATLNLTSALYNDVIIFAYPNLQIDLGAGSGVPISLNFEADGTIPGAQSISGIAYDDIVVEGSHTGFITFSIFTTDPDYSTFTINDLIIEIDDNDATQGVNVVFSPDAYMEGTTDIALNISLFTNPNALVTIYATPDMQLDLGAGAGIAVPVEFDLLTDATEPHLINISIMDDYDVEGDHTGTITFNIVTFDPSLFGYDIANAIININDDDELQGVNLVYPAIDLYAEGTIDLELNLSLWTNPNESVTIHATPDMQLDLGAGFGVAVPIVFDLIADATLPHITNFSIDNNYIIEGEHTGTITFLIETADPVFDGFTIPDAIINISDDDEEQGVTVITPTIDPYIEGATGITIDLSLFSIPNDIVFIYASSDEQLDLGGGPGETVYFEFAASVAGLDHQTLNITIFDDALVEGLHSATIDFSIGTSDPMLSGYTIPSVSFNIVDNDEEIGINDVDQNLFSIYPTVNNGIFTVQTNNLSGTSFLSIVNMIGQNLYNQTLNSEITNIDISSIPAGKYMVMVNNNNLITTESIQIVK